MYVKGFAFINIFDYLCGMNKRDNLMTTRKFVIYSEDNGFLKEILSNNLEVQVSGKIDDAKVYDTIGEAMYIASSLTNIYSFLYGTNTIWKVFSIFV